MKRTFIKTAFNFVCYRILVKTFEVETAVATDYEIPNPLDGMGGLTVCLDDEILCSILVKIKMAYAQGR